MLVQKIANLIVQSSRNNDLETARELARVLSSVTRREHLDKIKMERLKFPQRNSYAKAMQKEYDPGFLDDELILDLDLE